MFRKIGVVGVYIVAVLVFVMAGVFIVDRMQRSQDQKTLAQIIDDNALLQGFKNQKAIEEQVACKPTGSDATYCPALLYKISKQECFEHQSKFGADKKWCGHHDHLSLNGRNIEIRFGQAYERSDGNLYAAVIMNERNLLSL